MLRSILLFNIEEENEKNKKKWKQEQKVNIKKIMQLRDYQKKDIELIESEYDEQQTD